MTESDRESEERRLAAMRGELEELVSDPDWNYPTDEYDGAIAEDFVNWRRAKVIELPKRED